MDVWWNTTDGWMAGCVDEDWIDSSEVAAHLGPLVEGGELRGKLIKLSSGRSEKSTVKGNTNAIFSMFISRKRDCNVDMEEQWRSRACNHLFY